MSVPGLIRTQPGPVPTLAHRCGGEVAPENTLGAIASAARAGVQWCELDACRCADGIVVLHDSLLDRTTNGTGLVRAHPISEVVELDAGSWFGRAFARERVPRLREALALAHELDIKVLIDAKERFEFDTGVLIDMILEDIRSTRAGSMVAITSFDQHALTAVRARDPHVRTEFIAAGRFVDITGVARAAHADMVNFDLKRFAPEDAVELKSAGVAVRLSLPPHHELESLAVSGLDLRPRIGRWLSEGLIDVLAGDDPEKVSKLAADFPAVPK